MVHQQLNLFRVQEKELIVNMLFSEGHPTSQIA